jgi:GntR family transcriptional regulator
MHLRVDFTTGSPVYLQVVDQIKAAIASGAVREGDALPSVRTLAEDLRVNRNTVAKAYGELEHQHVIESRAGRGCFVRATGSPLRKDARLKLLAAAMDPAVVQAHHLQITRDDFLRLAAERFAAFEERRSAAAGS